MTFGFQWHLTDRCNLACAHCYQGRGATVELGLGELRALADRLFAALPGRALSVNLTGGEPLVLPWIFELIDHLSPRAEVNLITNGTIATPTVLRRLAASPVRLLKVSIEAADRATNDELRGPGAFDHVTANIARSVDAGLEVVLMVTLSATNLHTIAATTSLARDLGTSGVIFERFVPLGRGRAMAAAVLTAAQWRLAVAEVCRASGLDDLDSAEIAPYRAFWLGLSGPGETIELRGAACNLGPESMALMPDGTVYPCRRLPLPVGNARREPFAAILERLERWSVAAVRPRLSGACGRCPEPGCAGCRALAFALTGDPFVDDVHCLI